MQTTSPLILGASVLILGLVAANADMIVRTKDGRTFTVKVDSSEIESISFTSPGQAPVTQPGPISAATMSNLGRVLRVREDSGQTAYEGVWTRRGTSNAFDGVWPGPNVKDTLILESVIGNQVVFSRPGTGRYTGTLSPDRKRIVSGTMSWAPGYVWTATIELGN